MSKRAFIKQIVSVYPENIELNSTEGRLTHKIGVYKRPTTLPQECASDLAVLAAEKLFATGSIKREEVQALVLCTQTPDYVMPATSCVLQGRLNLEESTLAFDFNHGCSGFIYGLSICKGLIESGQVDNVLLITADTMSKLVHRKDMRVAPLFGDSASAILLSSVYTRQEPLSAFKFGTNGADFRKIVVNYGGMRMKYADREFALKEVVDQFGNVRTDEYLYMDGKAVVKFTQHVVPPMLDAILKTAFMSKDDVDNYIFHQANKYMLESVQSACGLNDVSSERYFNNCEDTGNTASASIPNAINKMQELNIKLGKRCVLMGFGVGLSWGGCVADLSMLD